MSKEQAKGFFEAISKDKQLADEVKEVVRGQATNQEKAKELLSLAKAHNFNFTEDELKRSLSREDLAYIAGGSGFGQKMISSVLVSTTGLGGAPVPLQLPVEQPAAIVQQAARNAQNQGENQDGNENEAPPAANEEEVNEIRELTPEEIAERQRERVASELRARVNRLNTLYYRLLYVPQGQDLMNRIQGCIATVGNSIHADTTSMQEQSSIVDALIHEAEEMLQSAEQQRGEEIAEELREEIQHGLNTLALILQRTHTGRPGETDLYTDVQTFLANRDSYSREERIRRARWLLSQAKVFHSTLNWNDPLHLDNVHMLFNLNVWSLGDDEQAVLEERLENNALPWLTQVGAIFGVPGEHGLALEIQEFLATIDDDFTDEHLAEMNSLLERAREIMMNRARAYTRFDTDQFNIRNNDLQLAQMLGIDKEYIQEKIKNKIKMSPNDITGIIELPDGDTVRFDFIVGSGTLVLTGSGNTEIGGMSGEDHLWAQLQEAGVFSSVAENPRYWSSWTNEQIPTPNYPFVVRNLIIGDGITKIGVRAFAEALSLRAVYFMGPVRFVGSFAFCVSRFVFSGRSHLVEVGFAQPEVVECVEDAAFAQNETLVSVNIPQSANIDKAAFYGCDKLEEQGCLYCKQGNWGRRKK